MPNKSSLCVYSHDLWDYKQEEFRLCPAKPKIDHEYLEHVSSYVVG